MPMIIWRWNLFGNCSIWVSECHKLHWLPTNWNLVNIIWHIRRIHSHNWLLICIKFKRSNSSVFVKLSSTVMNWRQKFIVIVILNLWIILKWWNRSVFYNSWFLFCWQINVYFVQTFKTLIVTHLFLMLSDFPLQFINLNFLIFNFLFTQIGFWNISSENSDLLLEVHNFSL